MTPEEKLQAMGIELGAPQAPGANYLPVVQVGDLVYTSGNGPYLDGTVAYSGHVGNNISLEDGYAAARLAMLNTLKVLRHHLGSLDRIQRFVKVTAFVSSAPDFIQQPQVINGASDLLVEVFGNQGRHARCAIGVASLPRGMAVELEVIAQVSGT